MAKTYVDCTYQKHFAEARLWLPLAYVYMAKWKENNENTYAPCYLELFKWL